MGFMSSVVERRDGVSLENPNVSLGGTTLIELLGGGRSTATGKRVGFETALNFSAVFAALNMTTGTVAALPIKLYKRLANGGKDEERGHPAFDLLHNAPNEEMTAATYKATVVGHGLTRGNHWSEVVRDGAGRPAELWPLHPDRIRFERRGDKPFWVMQTGIDEIVLPWDRVLFIPGIGFDGRKGYSPITLARESIGLGLATEEFGARFFGNASVPSGILASERTLGEEGRKNLKRGWDEAHAGLGKQRRVAVLEEGVTWQQIGLSAEDSQFLETRKFQIREVARWFNIPPHKLRDLEDATFSNIEEQNIEYMEDTIDPWLVRIEQAMNQRLLSPRERKAGLFVEFVREARLRASTEKRGQFYAQRFNTGSITPNEIRALENANPQDGGDVAFIPVNMIPISQALTMSTQERAMLLSAESPSIETPEADTRSQTPEYRSPAMRQKLITTFSPLFSDAMSRMVRGEMREVLKNGKKLLAGPSHEPFLRWLEDYYFDLFPAFARSVVEGLFRSYAEAVAKAASDEVDGDPPDVELLTDDYTTRFVRKYAASSRGQLLQLAKDSEQPIEAIEERLAEWAEGATEEIPTRAEKWAEREVRSLGSEVAKAAFIAAGIMTLRWFNVGSDTCPFCRAMNGRKVGIRDSFLSGGDFQPEGADAPLALRGPVFHPPIHKGCDCYIGPG